MKNKLRHFMTSSLLVGLMNLLVGGVYAAAPTQPSTPTTTAAPVSRPTNPPPPPVMFDLSPGRSVKTGPNSYGGGGPAPWIPAPRGSNHPSGGTRVPHPCDALMNDCTAAGFVKDNAPPGLDFFQDCFFKLLRGHTVPRVKLGKKDLWQCQHGPRPAHDTVPAPVKKTSAAAANANAPAPPQHP